MGQHVHNVRAYYHGNDGERGLEFSYHLAFDDLTIKELKKFVKNEDAVGFLKWMKENHPIAAALVMLSNCPWGTFQTLRESGVLDTQTKRKPKLKRGPDFPKEFTQKSKEVIAELLAEEQL